MPDNVMDIVTVAHRDDTWAQMLDMFRDCFEHHPEGLKVIPVDNRKENRGFAAGCNLGAALGDAPYIGFLNPDTLVKGPFMDRVRGEFEGSPEVVITGCRFGKDQRELNQWGLYDWCCGAALFVRRDWFTEVGGFDERYFLYFEESDLCRQAQERGRKVHSIQLPLEHSSPTDDPPRDVARKHHAFEASARLFYAKWKLR